MFLDNATRIEGKKTKILLDPYELKMFKGESYEGVLGVLVTRPRAWRHGQGHSQHDQEVGRVPLLQYQPSGWRCQEWLEVENGDCLIHLQQPTFCQYRWEYSRQKENDLGFLLWLEHHEPGWVSPPPWLTTTRTSWSGGGRSWRTSD